MPKLPALALAILLAGQVAACGDGITRDQRDAARDTVNSELRAEAAEASRQRAARIDARPESRAAIAAALDASASDFTSEHAAALTDAALALYEAGACEIADFSEWGWTRSQSDGVADTFLTYCRRGPSLSRHTVTLSGK